MRKISLFILAMFAVHGVFAGFALPGEKGFPKSPAVKITSDGAVFQKKGRMYVEQGFNPEKGVIELTAAFNPEKLADGEKRRINFLLTFTGNKRTIASLALNQYAGQSKMLLTFTAATEDGQNISCGGNCLFESGKDYKIRIAWQNGKLTLAVNGTELKSKSYTGVFKRPERTIIGFPGSRQTVPMTLKSITVDMAAQPEESVTSLPLALELPGAEGFPKSPGVKFSADGAEFAGNGRMNFAQGFDSAEGLIDFTASFNPEKLADGEKRKINFLLTFTANKRTAAALTLNQYANRKKMLLSWDMTKGDGKNISCGAEYPFAPGKDYRISIAWGKGKISLSVNGTPVKTVSYTGELKSTTNLIIGFPGYRQAMPMTLKSFRIYGKMPEKKYSVEWRSGTSLWQSDGKNLHIREIPGQGLEIRFDGGKPAVLNLTEPVFLRKGDNHIRAAGTFRTLKSEYGSLIVPRLNSSMITPVLVMSGDRIHKPLAQFKPHNQPDRFDFSVTGQPRNAYFFSILFYGNPSTVILEKASVSSAGIIRKGRPEANPENRSFNLEDVDKSLAALTPSRPEIRKGVNRTGIFLDGKPVPPAIYRRGPHYPFWSRYKSFGDAGINLYMFFAYFGTPSHTHRMNVGGLWQGRDRYDFTKLAHELRVIHSINPKARVILVTSIEPYNGWEKDFPDAVFTNAKGEKGYGLTTAKLVFYGKKAEEEHRKHPNEEFFAVPSNYGEEFRNEVTKTMRALVRYLENDPAGKIVCGIHIVGGADGQFFPYDRDATRGEDHSPSAKRAWEKYLRHKYGNDTARLRKAWQDGSAVFENAPVPDMNERGRDFNSGKQPTLRGRDYMLFTSEALTDLRLALCQAVKEESGGRLLAGVYYPSGSAGNYHIGKMLDSPYADFLIDIRKAAASGSFLLRNKLYIGELDMRVPDIMTPVYNYTYDWAMFRSTARQTAANVVQREGGMYHLFDIGEAYYSNPETVKFFGQVQNELAAGLDSKVGITPQIGVFQEPAVYAGYSFMECNHLRQVIEHSVAHTLDHSGIPWQNYLARDIFRSDLKLPPIVYFPAVPDFTPAEFALIREKAKKSGSVIIYGYFRPFTAEKTSAVAGFTYSYPPENRSRPVSIATGKGFTAGLQGKVLGESYTGFSFGGMFPMNYEVPAVITSEKGDTVLAVYQNTGNPSMVMRRKNGVTEIANGAPAALSPAFFRNIARSVNCEILCENDNVTVYAESGLLTAVCDRGGDIVIKIPSGFTVEKSITGHKYSIQGSKLFFHAPNDGEVAFFKLKRIQ